MPTKMRQLHGEIVEVTGTKFWGHRGGWRLHAPKEMERRRKLRKVQKQSRKANR